MWALLAPHYVGRVTELGNTRQCWPRLCCTGDGAGSGLDWISAQRVLECYCYNCLVVSSQVQPAPGSISEQAGGGGLSSCANKGS